MSDSMIEESVGRLFSANVDRALLEKVEGGAFPDALWALATESGFDRVVAAEEAGGIGETWSAAYPILRGVGYWQVPLPLAETMIGAMLLSMAGIELPEGPIAVVEAGAGNSLQVSSGASPRVSGKATGVAWARHARWAVVSSTDRRILLLDLKESATVSIGQRTNYAKLPTDIVQFDGAQVFAHAANPIEGLVTPVWTLGAIARSMMMVGALEAVLEQSVQYANDRVQFGRPIGKNQAIQQQLALLAGDVACARMAALVAGRDAPSPSNADCPRTRFSAAVAKIRAGEAATRGTSIAHQVHGAIGFTYECMLNFATRRLWAWRDEFGSDAWWAEGVGRAAIATGSNGFWPCLTERRFEVSARGARP